MASPRPQRLSNTQAFSVIYHDIFDYPLTIKELEKWQARPDTDYVRSVGIEMKRGYFFVKGRKDLVKRRKERELLSLEKLRIAKNASSLLERIPTVLFVGITGSLAMNNATKESDIDLMIIVSHNTLWTTRLIVSAFLVLTGKKIRQHGQRDEKDKLCLNIWMDENDLYFENKNIFTAHEVAQIVPLVNKNKTYEKIISINKWILEYWPNAAKPHKETKESGYKDTKKNLVFQYLSILISLFVEKLTFKLQLWYMQGKVTRETITPTRAFFHPVDWSEKVKKKLILLSTL